MLPELTLHRLNNSRNTITLPGKTMVGKREIRHCPSDSLVTNRYNSTKNEL